MKVEFLDQDWLFPAELVSWLAILILVGMVCYYVWRESSGDDDSRT